MEAVARWGGFGARPAERWLETNPTIGKYDPAEYRRRVEQEYGPQPEWTH
jgi:hypothetical protein